MSTTTLNKEAAILLRRAADEFESWDACNCLLCVVGSFGGPRKLDPEVVEHAREALVESVAPLKWHQATRLDTRRAIGLLRREAKNLEARS